MTTSQPSAQTTLTIDAIHYGNPNRAVCVEFKAKEHTMNHLDEIRAQIKDMTTEEREAFFAQRAAARKAEQDADKVRRMQFVADAFRGQTPDGFAIAWPKGVHSAISLSTEMLEADVLKGDRGVMTHPRQAEQLLRLDTVARRQRADWEANTLGNLQGGTQSSNLSRAVSDLLRMIEDGTEDQEMYGERVAREQREREADLRKTHPGAIYHHPAMRRD